MRPFVLTLGVFIFLAVTAGNGPAQNTGRAVQTPPKPIAAGTEDAKLSAAIAKIASAANGHVGAYAVVLETGVSASLKPDEHFPMQSVCKFPIAMTVLAQVDAGKLKLDQKIRIEKSDMVNANMFSAIRDEHPDGVEMTLLEILQSMVGISDGTASDVLFKLVGRGPAVSSFLQSVGVTGINLINTEDDLGRNWETQYQNWATPRAATDLLRALQEQKGLTSSSRALLMKIMAESTPGAARLKGLLPAGTVVVHKTGTSGSHEGLSAATNDVGIVNLPNGKHLLIAVFVSNSHEELKVREGVIAQIARAAWDQWAK